jgi:hypothetical protein
MECRILDTTEHATLRWRIYWGPGPLPVGAVAEGVVTRPTGERGALLRLRGHYYQGNAGVIRSLPDDESRASPGRGLYGLRCYDDRLHVWYPEHEFRDYGRDILCHRCGIPREDA